MRRKGVCYDVGREMLGRSWRPEFRSDTVRRELGIIRDDLRCNAVRLQGRDPERLRAAGALALELGLEVWFSPELWDQSAETTLAYLATAARTAHALEEKWPGRVVFSVGSELTLFMRGVVPGESVFERLASPSLRTILRSGAHNVPLNEFLGRACREVRAEFRGPLTYASLPFESVDWSPFDWVGADLYRETATRDRYGEVIRRLSGHGKPVANMEFGCCTFRGAEELGGRGWQIIDLQSRAPRLTGNYVYDQGAQARELTDLLRVNEAGGVDATFVFTFVTPPPEASPEDLRRMASAPFDLDIASYSLVKWLPEGRGGQTYPGMPWEPKESFRAVARFYEGR